MLFAFGFGRWPLPMKSMVMKTAATTTTTISHFGDVRGTWGHEMM
jgi:hypothetical protein